MSNPSVDPGFHNPRACFIAQSDPHFDPPESYLVNPDVGGIAVAVANIVVNVVLPFLLRWDNHEAQTTILILLSQVYPILIATVASVGTPNLTLFDAHFALAVTASPVSVYFIYSSFRSLFARNPAHENLMFKNIKTGKTAIRMLGIALPFLWLAINAMASFHPTAFSNSSKHCRHASFVLWFEFQILSNFIGILDVMGRRDLWNDFEHRGGLGMLSLLGLWIWGMYLVRHQDDILAEYTSRCKVNSNLFLVKRWYFRAWNVFSSPWFVITEAHPWMIFVIVICLHWSWALGIAKGMVFEEYQLSYGQMTSLFSALPPLLSFVRLVYNHRHNLLKFFIDLPWAFWRGVQFILTGSPNPWDYHPSRQSPPLSIEYSKGWVVLVTSIWLIATCADGFWIMAYVYGGSRPNPRSPINDPHSAWKPFSISLYVFGYCVACMNILIWSVVYRKSASQLPVAVVSVDKVIPRTWPPQTRWGKGQIGKVVFFPFAFFLCAAPFFSPFAALPLAQQQQWDHFCDNFPGEAVLIGRASSIGTATFYLAPEGSLSTATREKADFLFSLDLERKIFYRDMTIDPLASTSSVFPSISKITYDYEDGLRLGIKGTLIAMCEFPPSVGGTLGNTTDGVICGQGLFSSSPYLQLILDSANTTTRVYSVDKEWEFTDDAPSVVLRRTGSGFLAPAPTAMGHEDEMTLVQTAVTRRNHCEDLKVCLGERTLGFDTLSSLGLLLRAQTIFAASC